MPHELLDLADVTDEQLDKLEQMILTGALRLVRRAIDRGERVYLFERAPLLLPPRAPLADR